MRRREFVEAGALSAASGFSLANYAPSSKSIGSPEATQPKPAKVYQAISDAMHAEGVTMAFALMGDANQDLFVDMAERHRVEVVSCRHEQNVVAIADGYTRFGGDIGVALVTTGPGLTNTATSLVAAMYRRSPVLVLAGAPSLGDLHSTQLIDQVAFGQLLAGTATTLDTPQALAAQLDRVFGHIRERRGPVVLNLPSNVQHMEAPKGWSYRPNYGGYLPTVPRGEELLVAARCLAASKSPAIVAGQGAVRGGAAKIIGKLSAYLRAPIATTLPAKGLCAGEPLWIGTSGGLGEGVALSVLDGSCDVLIAVGASLNEWTTHHGDLVKGRQVIQIDRDEQAFGTYHRADVALQGDARVTLEALFEHVRQLVPSPRPANHGLERKIAAAWNAHRAPIEYETARDGTIDPRLAIREIDRLLPEKRIVVAAGGHAGYLVCQLLRINSPTDWNYTIDFGALGQGLGTAIGAAFARRGERVYHLTADGEFMMNLSDFYTAVTNALPMTIVVLNDQAFGQERHDLEHKKLPAKYAMQPSPDFARLAEGFGAQGFRFDTPESLVGLPAALERAESFQGPTVLDVRINGAYEAPVSQEIAKALM
jgi:acetolactate synthase I/II/III large subunit